MNQTPQYDNPYKALMAAGVPLDSHESDLYAKATPDALRIVKATGWTWTLFMAVSHD